jgi:calcineurin-like phosphoesterase family protein
MIFFTADTHFFHENVIRHSKRPFTSLDAMHEALITNWNTAVTKADTVYHLGDFAISWGSKSKAPIGDTLARLNGQKYLVTGNHDRKEVTNAQGWAGVYDAHEIKVDLGGQHKQRIVLNHYAQRTWNQMHRGAWMLHGHSHGSLSDIGGKILDVGVDCCYYAPISIERLRGIMEARPVITYDHHTIESGADDAISQ